MVANSSIGTHLGQLGPQQRREKKVGKKIEASKWVAWGIGILVLLCFIGFGVAIVAKKAERKILVESHQYKEGMADRSAVFRASLAEINSRLASGVDDATRADLEAQRSMINVQLKATRR